MAEKKKGLSDLAELTKEEAAPAPTTCRRSRRAATAWSTPT
jgi:hypothetical protein